MPIVFGTEMQANVRARSSPAGCCASSARQYYALAAAAPEFAGRGRRARRASGSAACRGSPPGAEAAGRRASATAGIRPATTCGGSSSRNQILFDWLTLDDPDARRHWRGDPAPKRECPALRLADGTTLFRPELAGPGGPPRPQTARALAEYDTVIIGGGPAGLAAAVYGASEGLRTLVVEREAPGGQAETSSRIENYLGFPNGISGDELGEPRAAAGAPARGGDPGHAQVVHVDPRHERSIVLDGDEMIRARAPSSSPPA